MGPLTGAHRPYMLGVVFVGGGLLLETTPCPGGSLQVSRIINRDGRLLPQRLTRLSEELIGPLR
jgi:hypothetical protein